LDGIEIAPGDGVLDLGCGSGDALVQAAARVGSEGFVIGVDMTDAMVREARIRIRTEKLDNVDVRSGLIECLPICDASVHRVISNCVVCLSPEKDRVFTEIARVLKAGGTFCISDIVAEAPPVWLRTILEWRGSCLASAANERTYIEGLTAAGLEEISVGERVAYDATRMRAFVDPNLPQVLWRMHGLAELIANTIAKAGWRLFRGQLASVRIAGKKPAKP
jgi:SAM-dependent methyltransferase